ncbi:hypothetical protein T440DRAFT_472118 [Plenodomus tracheiphilus IPT5]|uniref:Uncharacterized protein n=1 Tax=Plenodomus tracheiphilus IPT5 TaxID=1408161 RepID=A0A6A7AS31_9PLEO|nr:hypothetical protein T440DRAFT_472118 [Plenodomus tracheiphilus IPT5]
MSWYWYCCQCGDGAHNVSITPSCPGCSNHSRCGFCDTVADTADSGYNDNYNQATLNTNGSQQQAFSQKTYNSPPTTGQYAHDSATNTIAATDLNVGDGLQQPYGTKNHGPVYRWSCCACRGDNSCSVDVSCAFCGDHARCVCCYVYDANGK